MKLSSKIAKIASAVLALTLLLSLTGCQMVARFIGDVLREVMPMQTKAPDIEPTPYPQPTERVVDEACENALKELDAKMFAESVSGVPEKPVFGERIVADVIYRDGTVIDHIYQVLED